MAAADTEQFMTETETGEMIHRTLRSMRDLRYRGVGPAHIKIGSRVLYRRTAVMEWLLAHEVTEEQAN
ncbi:AlpA family transcriptional regulator [Brachybacterium sp. sponge]|uniref:helix-turn-helix transcriptional regulator n=1 Tax=Brachybacterium sp. sponge TaxID=1775432 RepID=UPI0007A3FDA0|nr:helix-turn-helix domain-containing protein [Brachybacterium sp. sponge]